MELLQQRIDTLWDEVKHGDPDHQAWLKQAIIDHFCGKKPQPPYGKGTKEALQARITELEAQLAAKKSWKFMTRQDVNYILTHTLAFFLGYSGMMAAHTHFGVPLPTWFDWSALNGGLITAGVANMAIGLANKEVK